MSIYEIIMLVCFGAAWPLSIYKTLRTRVVAGKSPLFMIVIALGYVCGILHKWFYLRDAVIVLYIINLMMVLADLSLYYYYNAKDRMKADDRKYDYVE